MEHKIFSNICKLLCLIIFTFVFSITMTFLEGNIDAYADSVSESETAKPAVIFSSVSADSGDSIKITVDIKNNPGITTLDFFLTYDSSVMEMTSKSNGSLLKGFLTSQSNEQQPFYCGWINSLQKENCVEDGTLVNFWFKIKENAAPGKYQISADKNSITAYDASLNEISFMVDSGVITLGNISAEEPSEQIEPTIPPETTVPSASPASPTPVLPSEPSDITAGNENQDSQDIAEADQKSKNEKILKKFRAMSINITSASYSKKKDRVTLKFKKTNSGIKCPEYEIWRSTKKNGKFKKIFTTKKVIFINKTLSKSTKTYYYRIRGVREFDGKKYYTKWSKKVKVSIKR